MNPHSKHQLGDYVIELPTPRAFWIVRLAGRFDQISQHNTRTEAKAAVRRYQAADSRRIASEQMKQPAED